MTNEIKSKSEAQQAAQRGVELYRKKKELKKELDEVKQNLRDYAEETADPDAPRLTIETPEGEVMISFVSDSVFVSKMDEEDAEVFEMELGHLRKVLFNKKVKYKTKSDFEEKLKNLSDSQKSTVEEYLTRRSNAPKVQFPR